MSGSIRFGAFALTALGLLVSRAHADVIYPCQCDKDCVSWPGSICVVSSVPSVGRICCPISSQCPIPVPAVGTPCVDAGTSTDKGLKDQTVKDKALADKAPVDKATADKGALKDLVADKAQLGDKGAVDKTVAADKTAPVKDTGARKDAAPGSSSSGCGCSTATSLTEAPWLAGPILLLVVVLRRRRVRDIALQLMLVLGACSSTANNKDGGSNACTPNTTQACLCLGQPNGVQTCASNGAGWTACQCVPAKDAAIGDARADLGSSRDGGGPKADMNLGSDPLPEGNTGIAAKYKGDVNIASDPAVVFADDFESYGSATNLTTKWSTYYQASQTVITTTAANVYRGKQALEFNVPKQTAELSNTVGKMLSKELDVLFLRYHSKYDTSFDVVGSSHNGSFISAHYFNNGQATPGVPANGTNKFLAAFENWRGEAATPNPGHLNVYIYHPEQRSQWGDHFFPTGIVMPNTSQAYDFGPKFVKRSDIVPKLGQWYSYELMVKANTPGKRDGRIACWLDGKLIADFPNLRLRDVATLKIDRFDVGLHIGSNTAAATKKWYDNVVAATSYIGPVVD